MNSETQNSVSIIDEVIDEQEFNENELIIDEKQQLNNSFNESLIKKSYCNSSQTKPNNSENVEPMDVSFVANNNCNNDLVITNGDIDSIDHNNDNNDNNGNQTDEDSTQSDSIEDKKQLTQFNINHIKYSIVEVRNVFNAIFSAFLTIIFNKNILFTFLKLISNLLLF
jgi:hypothetical protein